MNTILTKYSKLEILHSLLGPEHQLLAVWETVIFQGVLSGLSHLLYYWYLYHLQCTESAKVSLAKPKAHLSNFFVLSDSGFILHLTELWFSISSLSIYWCHWSWSFSSIDNCIFVHVLNIFIHSVCKCNVILLFKLKL